MIWFGALSWLPVALAAAGLAYQLVALACLLSIFAGAAPAPARGDPVTLLKPLHGAEPRLAENLATFLVAEHAGPVQLLCGVGEPGNGAVPAVEVLIAAHPGADITLTTGPRAAASNGKIGNLCAMLPAARHPILVLSDSDMCVGPDYLARVLAALDAPGVGAVTCLYRGRGDAGPWSRLSASMISYATLPSMTVGLVTGIDRPCMGSTIALRRETLEAIGGFERFADTLADDYAIGAAVRALGLTVAVPPLLLTHAGAEASPGQVWRQHLRWAATIRAVNPAGHLGSGITHALPLALLAALLHPLPGLALAAAILTTRLAIAAKVDRIAGESSAPRLFLPLGDCLGFMVYVASLGARTLDWRGQGLAMRAEGRIAPQRTRKESKRPQ